MPHNSQPETTYRVDTAPCPRCGASVRYTVKSAVLDDAGKFPKLPDYQPGG